MPCEGGAAKSSGSSMSKKQHHHHGHLWSPGRWKSGLPDGRALHDEAPLLLGGARLVEVEAAQAGEEGGQALHHELLAVPVMRQLLARLGPHAQRRHRRVQRAPPVLAHQPACARARIRVRISYITLNCNSVASSARRQSWHTSRPAQKKLARVRRRIANPELHQHRVQRAPPVLAHQLPCARVRRVRKPYGSRHALVGTHT